MDTFELIQKLLKTNSSDLKEIDEMFREYQSKQITSYCANIDVNSKDDVLILNELKKRKLDPNDDFFKEYNFSKRERQNKAFIYLLENYQKIMITNNDVNIYGIINNLRLIDYDIFKSLCKMYNPKKIVKKIEKLKIINNEGNCMDVNRFNLYKHVLCKFDFVDLKNLLTYCEFSNI